MTRLWPSLLPALVVGITSTSPGLADEAATIATEAQACFNAHMGVAPGTTEMIVSLDGSGNVVSIEPVTPGANKTLEWTVMRAVKRCAPYTVSAGTYTISMTLVVE